MMLNTTPQQNLYAAIIQIAYSIACAGKKIRTPEAAKYLSLVSLELEDETAGFDISQMVFDIMILENCTDVKKTYDLAIDNIKRNSQYLNNQMKAKFIHTMEEVTDFFPPVTYGEVPVIEKFKADFIPLKSYPIINL
jgi:uncharacterized protein YxeA